jgi:hypothetical protein
MCRINKKCRFIYIFYLWHFTHTHLFEYYIEKVLGIRFLISDVINQDVHGEDTEALIKDFYIMYCHFDPCYDQLPDRPNQITRSDRLARN